MSESRLGTEIREGGDFSDSPFSRASACKWQQIWKSREFSKLRNSGEIGVIPQFAYFSTMKLEQFPESSDLNAHNSRVSFGEAVLGQFSRTGPCSCLEVCQ